MTESMQTEKKQLQERIKELTALYNLSYLIEERENLPDILQGAVDLIPDSMQYPDITCARIDVEDVSYTTRNYADTEWNVSRDLHIGKHRIGCLKVCYLEQCSDEYEGPFQQEEINLITAIAERLQRVVERKKAEKELRESRAQYRELVEHTNSIILRWKPDGTITFVNEFAQSFFGYSREEIIGRNLIGTIVPETETTGRSLRHMIEDIVKNPDRYKKNENENMCSDGKRVWVNWTNKTIIDKQGNIAEILCVGNDISDKKRAEKKLKESENNFRAITESTSDAIILVDESYTITFWNPSAERIFGYGSHEILGESIFLIIPDHIKDAVHAALRKILTGDVEKQTGRTIETFALRKDGTEIPVEVSDSYWKVGGTVRFCSIVRDITERKQAEEEKNRLIAAIEQTNEAIIITDENGVIQFANATVGKTGGFSQKDIVGANLFFPQSSVYEKEFWQKVWEKAVTSG